MTPTKRGKSTAIRLEKIKKSNIDQDQVKSKLLHVDLLP